MTTSITQDLSTWVAQQNYVERLMDNSAFTAAHPDDTLVLAGPARFGGGEDDANNKDFVGNLLPIGTLMNFTMASSAPVQPLTSIGSGRTFHVRGKGNITFSIGRLFVDGRNLLRVLYTEAVRNQVNFQNFDDPAMARGNEEQYIINLDSELFYVPFGLCCLFRSKTRSALGGFYIELSMINTYNLGLQAGQAMVMENVNGVADRVLPVFPNTQKPQERAGEGNAPSLTQLNTVTGLGSLAADFIPRLTGNDRR